MQGVYCPILMTGAPDVPVSVQLTVASSTALHVSFQEPHNVNGASVTRYKSKYILVNMSSLDKMCAWDMLVIKGASAHQVPHYSLCIVWIDQFILYDTLLDLFKSSS